MDKFLKSIYFKRYKHFEKIYFQAWKNLIHRNPHVKKDRQAKPKSAPNLETLRFVL